jgi:hypothetical protein
VKILYKNIFNTTLNTFLVRAYNSVPPAPFGSQGLDRRIIVLAFNHQPKVKDIHLQQKINAELPGIFNWAWSMSEAEMVRRISTAGEIQAVKEASIQRFEDNNPWFVFLYKIFETGATIHPKTLYQRYASWSGEHGEHALGYKNFIKAIKPFGVYQKDIKNTGYYDYVIPAMKDFDIMAHLGINQKEQGSIDNSLSNSLQLPTNSLELPGNSLTENRDTEPSAGSFKGDKGETGEKSPLEQSALFNVDEYAPTDTSPHRSTESGATGWDDLPTPKPPEIDRQLSETVMIFSRKAIASEWENHINVALGVTAWKPKKVTIAGGKTTWQVRVINLTQEQIDLLAKVDTNSPPARPLLWMR